MADDQKMAKAMECYNHASNAVKQGNFDYAVAMYFTCTQLMPDKLLFRQALRAAECKMYKENRKGAEGLMAKGQIAAAKAKLRMAKGANRINAAEEVLKLNPWDGAALYELGAAAGEQGFRDTAIWVLETAVNADRQNADAWRLLGKYYEEDAQFDKAINAWETVKKVDPNDQDAAAKARQLAASATIHKGKYEDKDETKVKMHDAPKSSGPSDGPGAGLSPEERARAEIASLEAKIAADATNISLYSQLGDLYRRQNATEKALAAYQKGLDASGGTDIDLKVKMLEAPIEHFKRNLQIVKTKFEQLDANIPDQREKKEELKTKHNAILAEIAKREVELYRFKVTTNPNDYPSYFELGQRLLKFNQLDDAIKALQQGRNDAQRKWEALFHLGVAFWKKKNFPLAEKNLADSLQEVNPNDEEGRKRILYHRGRVAQDKGDTAVALENYNEVAAIDYGYADVSKRIDDLNAAQ
ncbi:MAG: tetratricopeptide repeat protein [Planctomycetota bacterium]